MLIHFPVCMAILKAIASEMGSYNRKLAHGAKMVFFGPLQKERGKK